MAFMISRRQFLTQSAVAFAAAVPARAFPLDLPLGFQSYDINNELSRNFEDACRTLAGYGYQLIDYVWLAHNKGVSPAVNAMRGEDVRKAFDAAGLRCKNCHFSWTELHDEYEKTIETAHVLGVNSVVCQSMSTHTKSADGWR
ncbi:MAG TPA: twin-arginine translocation signal domain-containing protein [Bryobacteraceae bacterium]|nr:twin-arginine translocation signal domain-containing protein [Bryobacteraceae bacterium]